MKIFDVLLDLLFPPKCAFCGLLLDGETRSICGECLENLEFAERGGVFAASYGGGVLNAVHKMKYGGRKRLAETMAEITFAKRAEAGVEADADLFVPVPMFKAKERARGYNQAAVFAKKLAELYGREYADCLVRTRDTVPQYGLNTREREKNVGGAFEVDQNAEEILKCAKIALCDDVYTTGATARACEAALLGAGAATVTIMTFAAAELKD